MPEWMTRELGSVLQILKVLELLLLGLCLSIGAAGAALLLRGLAPSVAAEADRTLASRPPVRRLLLGLVNAPAMLVLAIVLGQRGALKAVSLFLVLALLALTLVGLAAELATLGRRVRGGGGADGVLRETIVGGGIGAAAGLLPFVGQVLGIVVLLMALGTGVSWLLTRGRDGDVR